MRTGMTEHGIGKAVCQSHPGVLAETPPNSVQTLARTSDNAASRKPLFGGLPRRFMVRFV